jgi:hypothetical protein
MPRSCLADFEFPVLEPEASWGVRTQRPSQEVEKAKVRMQDPHAGVCPTELATSTQGCPASCREKCANCLVHDRRHAQYEPILLLEGADGEKE